MNRLARLVLAAVPGLALGAALGARLATPPPPPLPAAPQSGVQIVGPSAMLALQRAGEPVFDARIQGRPIPDATRRFPRAVHSSPLVVTGSQGEAQAWAHERGWRGLVRWVPAHLLEVRDHAGVAQIDAKSAWRAAQSGRAVIVDVSERDEWDAIRLPGSRRVSWQQIASGDRSWAPRDKAIVFT